MQSKNIKIVLASLGLVTLLSLSIYLQPIKYISWLLKASLFSDYTTQIAKQNSETSNIAVDKLDPTYQQLDCQVVVVGGGSGGVAAALQSSRLGVKTCLIEETDWVGGMLSNAGVAAIDGHEETASGIFKEIKTNVENYYKDRDEFQETKQCKVSNFCFEPRVGNKIIRKMISKEDNLQLFLNSNVEKIYQTDKRITGIAFVQKNKNFYLIESKVVIDATEFGDLMHLANIPYKLGYDQDSDEPLSKLAEDCVQPLTYVAILKNNPEDEYHVLDKPKNYDAENYRCLVDNSNRAQSSSNFDKDHFLSYGKMPNDKLMINIPSHSCGNDFHATAKDLESYSRKDILQKAKEYTLGFVYFVQTELGLSNLELYNEFGTEDKLAKSPYVRESRRLVGVTQLKEQDVVTPPKASRPKFVNSSIAIGDYPIDLHFCTTGIGDVFKSVKPYQIPYEVMIPKEHDGFIAAEKNISVSHIANGTTRLQPVVMSIGQAAGTAAAISVIDGTQPRDNDIAKIQQILINSGSNIYFFKDVPSNHFAYKDIINLAMESIIQGYPDLTFKPNTPISKEQLVTILGRFLSGNSKAVTNTDQLEAKGIQFPETFKNRIKDALTYEELVDIIVTGLIPELDTPADANPVPLSQTLKNSTQSNYYEHLTILQEKGIIKSTHKPEKQVSRAELAIILNRLK